MLMRYHWGLGVGHTYTQQDPRTTQTSSRDRAGEDDTLGENEEFSADPLTSEPGSSRAAAEPEKVSEAEESRSSRDESEIADDFDSDFTLDLSSDGSSSGNGWGSQDEDFDEMYGHDDYDYEESGFD
jgi:hypothetical protein